MISPSIIYNTGAFSLTVQILTGLFDLYVVFLDTPPYMQILKKVLWMEIFVQIIEGSFYIWLVRNFHKIGDITKYRYWDWIITTPTMLISFSMYLYYLKNRKESQSPIQKSIFEILYDKSDFFLPVFILNTLMLLAGYMAELGRISFQLAAVLGFIPFVIYFYMIYETFAKYTDFGQQVFWVFAGIWALYGVASVMSYTNKNIMYNILDLLAKNFFGIFIAGLLYFEHRNGRGGRENGHTGNLGGGCGCCGRK
jgi:hypothetical protein